MMNISHLYANYFLCRACVAVWGTTHGLYALELINVALDPIFLPCTMYYPMRTISSYVYLKMATISFLQAKDSFYMAYKMARGLGHGP